MDLQPSTTTSQTPQPPSTAAEETTLFDDDFIDSTCSTPFVSAPSSPGRTPISAGFYYSAPASPMHFAITSSSYQTAAAASSNVSLGYEFEFSARFGSAASAASGSMSSADELFLNGQIRPMKLSSHLERPQVLAPLLDLEGEDEDEEPEAGVVVRGRDLRLRDKSVRRRTRSMSPLRNDTPLEWAENEDREEKAALEDEINNGSSEIVVESSRDKVVDELGLGLGLGLETTPSVSASSSRSSSAGRSSKRWVFLKDFLRSKSEGRSNNKFWSTISFSPTKDKEKKGVLNQNQNLHSKVNKSSTENQNNGSSSTSKGSSSSQGWARKMTGKPTNGVGKRRVPASPHELLYKANRAQAEELRKKTFLPYRQGLFGCLGFSSKGYGAVSGFARALNPVSSR